MIPKHQLDLPAVFGRYLLLQRLNRGGMGEIFLAKLGEIQGFEKPIIIKKILPDLAQDEEFLQRFTAEAQIAIKLTHGNIVPVYEVGRIVGEYFLALQYIEGRDLRSLLSRCRERRHRIPPDICLFIAREIANGLAYAHRRTDEAGRPLALVHCDISPPNVLLSWEGEVKIIDFGIAKSAMQTVQTNTAVGFGKFGYMAPEQLIRGEVVDRRTDIYAVGVLLYELLTGERLFNFAPGIDFRRVAKEVTAGSFAPPSDRDLSLGSQYDKLVMRALRTNKDERYSTAEELRDEVQQHLYTMNPTISADTLAAFMRDLFGDAIDADRQMLLALSQTDMEPYRDELSDATSHTVSYAFAGLWSDNQPGEKGDEPPTLVASRPGMAVAALTSHASSLGSRSMRRAETVDALTSHPTQLSGHSLQSSTIPIVSRYRTLLLLGLTLGGLVGIGTALGLLLRQGPAAVQTPHSPRAVGAGRSSSPSLGHAGEAGSRMTFPPEAVGHADAGRPSAGASSRDLGVTIPSAGHGHSKLARVRGVGPHRPARVRATAKTPNASREAGAPREVSSAQVQRKFQQVQGEYSQFTRSYGQLLAGEWQKILFATTYGEMDPRKYERLDRMLNDLQRQMKRIQGKGQ